MCHLLLEYQGVRIYFIFVSIMTNDYMGDVTVQFPLVMSFRLHLQNKSNEQSYCYVKFILKNNTKELARQQKWVLL